MVINNWDMESIPLAAKAQLEDYVKKGGGLVWIAGEHNVYVDKKGKPEDALERTLPAKLAPPRSPEGTAVVLIIDKSSSMEGRKIELARLAAIGVVENLRPIDSVGVLIFDNSFQWAVPLRKAEDRATIKQLISGITPDGGTQIAPALTEAYQRILPQTAMYKHIVLLTDGISEEGDSMTLTKEALTNHVTISTVGLGQDVNRAFLEKVASNADGKSYFLNDPSGLEQILLRDVEEHTGVTAVEKTITPKVVKQAEILDGVGMDDARRQLKGYVRFQARPTSDTILMADREDPLLVRWQYGLGRAAVFTSRRQESVGRELGDVAGLRQALGQHLPRPAAARAAERDHGGFRSRERTNWWWIIASRATSRSRPTIARYFRFRPGWIPRAAEDGQGGGGPLSRPAGDRPEPGTVPRASAGRFARLPGSRASTGRKTKCRSTATTSCCCARSPPPPADALECGAATCSTPAAAAFRPRWNCGPDCWPWRFC